MPASPPLPTLPVCRDDGFPFNNAIVSCESALSVFAPGCADASMRDACKLSCLSHPTCDSACVASVGCAPLDQDERSLTVLTYASESQATTSTVRRRLWSTVDKTPRVEAFDDTDFEMRFKIVKYEYSEVREGVAVTGSMKTSPAHADQNCSNGPDPSGTSGWMSITEAKSLTAVSRLDLTAGKTYEIRTHICSRYWVKGRSLAVKLRTSEAGTRMFRAPASWDGLVPPFLPNQTAATPIDDWRHFYRYDPSAFLYEATSSTAPPEFMEVPIEAGETSYLVTRVNVADSDRYTFQQVLSFERPSILVGVSAQDVLDAWHSSIHIQFAWIDSDTSSDYTPNELIRVFFRPDGEEGRMTLNETKALIGEYDADNDGRLSIEELGNLLVSEERQRA